MSAVAVCRDRRRLGLGVLAVGVFALMFSACTSTPRTSTSTPRTTGRKPEMSLDPKAGPPGTIIHAVVTGCTPSKYAATGYSEANSVWVHDPYSENEGSVSASENSAVLPHERQGSRVSFRYRVKFADRSGATVLFVVFCGSTVDSASGTSATFAVT